jgi:hypothetical protein
LNSGLGTWGKKHHIFGLFGLEMKKVMAILAKPCQTYGCRVKIRVRVKTWVPVSKDGNGLGKS